MASRAISAHEFRFRVCQVWRGGCGRCYLIDPTPMVEFVLGEASSYTLSTAIQSARRSRQHELLGSLACVAASCSHGSDCSAAPASRADGCFAPPPMANIRRDADHGKNSVGHPQLFGAADNRFVEQSGNRNFPRWLSRCRSCVSDMTCSRPSICHSLWRRSGRPAAVTPRAVALCPAAVTPRG